MFKTFLPVAFLLIILGAPMNSQAAITDTSDTSTRACLWYSSTGVCLFYSGSVSCEDINARGVHADANYVRCLVAPTVNAADIAGVVFCSNNGNNVAPGVQGFLAGEFSGLATIYEYQIDQNGVATGINVKAEATEEQLAELSAYCQNPNWSAVDFVPAAMTATIEVYDSEGDTLPKGSASFYCTLPNPETLAWDKKAQAVERRPYTCSQN